MKSLDLCSYGDGQFVLSWNGKSPITVAELSQYVNLRHVVPYGFHQLQMGCLHTLTLGQMKLKILSQGSLSSFFDSCSFLSG